MHHDNQTPKRWRPARFFALIVLVGVLSTGCEVGWQGETEPTLGQAAVVAATRGVANWAADSSDCELEVVGVEHVRRFGAAADASGEIANSTPLLDGVQGCNDILTPREVREQDLYPTGSRSNYRSIVGGFLDESPTAAKHLVKVEWNSPAGQFSTLSAANADRIKIMFAPVGTVLGSDVAPAESTLERVDALDETPEGEAVWAPEGDETEWLVWQDSLTTPLEGVGTVPIEHGQTLAETGPEITVDWNPNTDVSEANCTIGGEGLVSSQSIEPDVSTSALNQQLAETDVRTEWREDTCFVIFQVDVGIAGGTVDMSSSRATNGPGYDISKSGLGQFWTFRRTYEWGITE